MPDKKKIRLMSRLAMYEKERGTGDEKVTSWFGIDYIYSELLKSVVCGTAAFFIVAASFVLYHYEEYMVEVYNADLVAAAKRAASYYVKFIAVFVVITAIIYIFRFRRAEKSQNGYYRALRRLDREFGRKDTDRE